MKKFTFYFLFFIIIASVSCTKENDVQKLSSSQQSSATKGHYIGEHFGGGIIFYLNKERTHGIIASTIDFEEPEPWARKDTLIHAHAAKVGAAANNNTKIYLALGASSSEANDYAVNECMGLYQNGYNDWYLPTKDELNEMYLHKDVIGGFRPFAYWSSTEIDANTAWWQNMGTGLQDSQDKFSSYSVRPVRYF
jgi:hypothetical protein